MEVVQGRIESKSLEKLVAERVALVDGAALYEAGEDRLGASYDASYECSESERD